MREPAASHVARQSDLGAFRAALVCFGIAALAGVAFRVLQAAGGPEWLELANLRHAHSHLMYFGWATAGVVALVGVHLRERGLTPGGGAFRLSAWAAVGAGVVSFPPFLLDGYEPTMIAGAAVPLSVLASAFGGLVWLAVAAAYAHRTWRAPRDHVLCLLDAAVVFLVAASLAAAARGAMTGAGAVAEAVAIQAFLGWFADGWLVLAVLALASARLTGPTPRRGGRWGRRLAVVGLPLSPLLLLPPDWLAAGLRALAGASGLALAAGLLALTGPLLAAAMRERAWWWLLPLGAIAVRAAVEAALVSPTVGSWGQQAGLRIVLLHVVLVTGVSAALWSAAATAWPARRLGERSAAWQASLAAMVASLVPLSGLWPGAGSGVWALWVAALAGTAPAVLALGGAAGPGRSARRWSPARRSAGPRARPAGR